MDSSVSLKKKPAPTLLFCLGRVATQDIPRSIKCKDVKRVHEFLRESDEFFYLRLYKGLKTEVFLKEPAFDGRRKDSIDTKYIVPILHEKPLNCSNLQKTGSLYISSERLFQVHSHRLFSPASLFSEPPFGRVLDEIFSIPARLRVEYLYRKIEPTILMACDRRGPLLDWH